MSQFHLLDFSSGHPVATNLVSRCHSAHLPVGNGHERATSILDDLVLESTAPLDLEGTIELQAVDGHVAIDNKHRRFGDAYLALHLLFHLLQRNGKGWMQDPM